MPKKVVMGTPRSSVRERSGACGAPPTGQSKVSVAACTFGDKTASKTIVLLGDSRAQMWFNTFRTIADAAHLKLVLLAKGACPAALGTFRLTTPAGVPQNAPWPACAAWHTFVLHAVKALKPTVIVDSSADNLYLDTSNGYTSPAQTTTAIADFLNALPAHSKRIVLGDFPNPGSTVSPTLCLSKNPSSIQKCTYRPSTNQVAFNNAQSLAVRQAGALEINEAAWLCTTSGCPPVVNGIPPYTIDGVHMQSSFTAYLTGVMWKDLKPYIGG